SSGGGLERPRRCPYLGASTSSRREVGGQRAGGRLLRNHAGRPIPGGVQGRRAQGSSRSRVRRKRKGLGFRGRSCSAAGGSLLAIETRCLTRPFTQIIEFGTAHLAARYDIDLLNTRGVQGENPFHADAVGDFSDGEGRAVAFAGKGDDDPLEDLRSLFFALYYFHVNPNGLPRTQCGDLFLGLFGFNLT